MAKIFPSWPAKRPVQEKASNAVLPANSATAEEWRDFYASWRATRNITPAQERSFTAYWLLTAATQSQRAAARSLANQSLQNISGAPPQLVILSQIFTRALESKPGDTKNAEAIRDAWEAAFFNKDEIPSPETYLASLHMTGALLECVRAPEFRKTLLESAIKAIDALTKSGDGEDAILPAARIAAAAPKNRLIPEHLKTLINQSKNSRQWRRAFKTAASQKLRRAILGMADRLPALRSGRILPPGFPESFKELLAGPKLSQSAVAATGSAPKNTAKSPFIRVPLAAILDRAGEEQSQNQGEEPACFISSGPSASPRPAQQEPSYADPQAQPAPSAAEQSPCANYAGPAFTHGPQPKAQFPHTTGNQSKAGANDTEQEASFVYPAGGKQSRDGDAYNPSIPGQPEDNEFGQPYRPGKADQAAVRPAHGAGPLDLAKILKTWLGQDSNFREIKSGVYQGNRDTSCEITISAQSSLFEQKTSIKGPGFAAYLAGENMTSEQRMTIEKAIKTMAETGLAIAAQTNGEISIRPGSEANSQILWIAAKFAASRRAANGEQTFILGYAPPPEAQAGLDAILRKMLKEAGSTASARVKKPAAALDGLIPQPV